MRKLLLSVATASALLAGVGLASAQTSTTTTSENWTTEQGNSFHTYSTSKDYKSFTDPNLSPSVGMALPETVTLYPLPETMKVPSADRYRYGMINNHPVVVESTSRKVIHTWE